MDSNVTILFFLLQIIHKLAIMGNVSLYQHCNMMTEIDFNVIQQNLCSTYIAMPWNDIHKSDMKNSCIRAP